MKKLLLMVGLTLSVGLSANSVRLYNGSKFRVQFICGPAGSDGDQSRWAVVDPGNVTTPSSTTQATNSSGDVITGYDNQVVYLNQDMSDGRDGALNTGNSSNFPPTACLVRNIDNYADVLTNVTPLVLDENGKASLAFYGTNQYGTSAENRLETYLGLTGWCGGGNC